MMKNKVYWICVVGLLLATLRGYTFSNMDVGMSIATIVVLAAASIEVGKTFAEATEYNIKFGIASAYPYLIPMAQEEFPIEKSIYIPGAQEEIKKWNLLHPDKMIKTNLSQEEIDELCKFALACDSETVRMHAKLTTIQAAIEAWEAIQKRDMGISGACFEINAYSHDFDGAKKEDIQFYTLNIMLSKKVGDTLKIEETTDPLDLLQNIIVLKNIRNIKEKQNEEQ